MRLHNWRAFYGENDLWFSIDETKNVTVIRAENSVGKTSLLTAINWCFFKQLPSEAEFENQDKLVNDFARLNENITKTKIEIEFRHEGKLYRAMRSYDQSTKTTHDLKLTELTDDGEIPLTATDPQKFINSVIPQEMAPHFFFYGEHTSKYMGEGGSRHFAKAVRSILGATVANMALSDLNQVFKDYHKEAAKSTSVEAETISDEIEEIDRKIAKFNSEIEQNETQEQLAQEQIDRLNTQLANSQSIKEDSKQRTRLESKRDNLVADQGKTYSRQKAWLNSYGIAVLAKDLIKNTREFLETEDTRKKIPGPYNEKFVNELLADEVCVCGRDLKKGSKEHDCVSSLLKNATDEIVMSRIMSTSSAFASLEATSNSAWETFKRNEEDLVRIQGDINSAETELNEISDRLSQHNTSDIAEKEEARKRAQQLRKKSADRRVELKTYIDRLQRDRADKVRVQNELTRQSDNAKRFVKKAQVAGELIRRLGSRLSDEEAAARSSIENRISDIIVKFMRRTLTAKLDKNYQLRILDENDFEAAKSTGEKQLLGLAFTAAIAHHAKNRRSQGNDILLAGTEAPLVVDSPFGHLDEEYRRAVSTFMPELASQVVLLVSRTQSTAEVMETLGDKIGVQYVLTRHNTAARGERPQEHIKINGIDYPLSEYDSDFSGTVLTEVASK